MEVITELHFTNKQEIYDLCNKYLKHIRESIKITTQKKESIGYFGWRYYYEHSDSTTQKKVFIEHIKAAQKSQLPLIVHTRSAEDDT